jgi:hypothetical protein
MPKATRHSFTQAQAIIVKSADPERGVDETGRQQAKTCGSTRRADRTAMDVSKGGLL